MTKRNQRRDGPADYDVGYGKPPRQHRFKPGQSGNPKGRPKARKNVATIVDEVFFRDIPISENGVRKTVPAIEGILRQVAMGALKGEARPLAMVFKLLPILEATRTTAASDDVSDGDDGNSIEVIQALFDMCGGDPAAVLASLRGGDADVERN